MVHSNGERRRVCETTDSARFEVGAAGGRSPAAQGNKGTAFLRARDFVVCCYVIAQERADLPEGYPRNTTDEPPSYFSKIDHGSNNEQRTTNNTSNLFFYRCPQQPFYRTYLRPQQPTLTLINTPPVRGPATPTPTTLATPRLNGWRGQFWQRILHLSTWTTTFI